MSKNSPFMVKFDRKQLAKRSGTIANGSNILKKVKAIFICKGPGQGKNWRGINVALLVELT